jgi:inosose dehydratase
MSAPSAIKVGCAAITWGGNDEQAIADISDLGFPGIQLRANAVRQYGANPTALRELLVGRHLAFVALSSGDVSIDPTAESQMIEQHANNARFLHDAGGLYLQLIDQRPRGRDVTRDDYRRLGRLLTEIGRRATDIGVTAAYHHHMGSLGEKPDEIDRVLDATDQRYVRLLLDVAHYQAGGGDPVAAIRRYRDRILFLHVKDLRRPVSADGPAYQFVELGRGLVDLKGVFAALREIGFQGWAVVELDSVPDPSRTPKEANAISKRYLEETVGLRIAQGRA